MSYRYGGGKVTLITCKTCEAAERRWGNYILTSRLIYILLEITGISAIKWWITGCSTNPLENTSQEAIYILHSTPYSPISTILSTQASITDLRVETLKSSFRKQTKIVENLKLFLASKVYSPNPEVTTRMDRLGQETLNPAYPQPSYSKDGRRKNKKPGTTNRKEPAHRLSDGICAQNVDHSDIGFPDSPAKGICLFESSANRQLWMLNAIWTLVYRLRNELFLNHQFRRTPQGYIGGRWLINQRDAPNWSTMIPEGIPWESERSCCAALGRCKSAVIDNEKSAPFGPECWWCSVSQRLLRFPIRMRKRSCDFATQQSEILINQDSTSGAG